MRIAVRKAPEDPTDNRSAIDNLFKPSKGKELKDEVESKTAEQFASVPKTAPSVREGGDKSLLDERDVEMEGTPDSKETVVGSEDSEAMKNKRDEIYQRALSEGYPPAEARRRADAYSIQSVTTGKQGNERGENIKIGEKERAPSLGRGMEPRAMTVETDDTRSENFRNESGRREKDISMGGEEDSGFAGFGRETHVIDESGQNPQFNRARENQRNADDKITMESYLRRLLQDPEGRQVVMDQILQDRRDAPTPGFGRGRGQEGTINEFMRRIQQMRKDRPDELATNLMNHFNRQQIAIHGDSPSLRGLQAENNEQFEIPTPVDEISQKDFMQRIFDGTQDVSQDPTFNAAAAAKNRARLGAQDMGGLSEEDKTMNAMNMMIDQHGLKGRDAATFRHEFMRLVHDKQAYLEQMAKKTGVEPDVLTGAALQSMRSGTPEFIRDKASHDAYRKQIQSHPVGGLMPNEMAEAALQSMQSGTLSGQQQYDQGMENIKSQLPKLEAQEQALQEMIDSGEAGPGRTRTLQRQLDTVRTQRRQYTSMARGDTPDQRGPSRDKLRGDMDTEQYGSDVKDPLQDPNVSGQAAQTFGTGETEEDRQRRLAFNEAFANMPRRGGEDDDIQTGFPMTLGDLLMKSVHNRLWWQGL